MSNIIIRRGPAAVGIGEFVFRLVQSLIRSLRDWGNSHRKRMISCVKRREKCVLGVEIYLVGVICGNFCSQPRPEWGENISPTINSLNLKADVHTQRVILLHLGPATSGRLTRPPWAHTGLPHPSSPGDKANTCISR